MPPQLHLHCSHHASLRTPLPARNRITYQLHHTTLRTFVIRSTASSAIHTRTPSTSLNSTS